MNRRGVYERPSVAFQFWKRVVLPIHDPDGCWLWSGDDNGNGYGTFRSQGKLRYAHRTSWEMHFGPIPIGSLVCHHCDNRGCVNPRHLFVGSPHDNSRDMVAKGRVSWGELRPLAKLTEADVIEILQSTARTCDLAIRYGVSQTAIYRVRAGTAWKKTSAEFEKWRAGR